jgi:hypothetical protein
MEGAQARQAGEKRHYARPFAAGVGMPVGFVADQWSVVDEGGLLVTSLSAASTEEDDFYLLLQHKRVYGAQDARMGMDQPYIEYCGQGWSWYGRILGFRLHRDRVEVQMDAHAAGEMGNDGRIEVRFALADAPFQALRRALAQSFAGRAYFHELA